MAQVRQKPRTKRGADPSGEGGERTPRGAARTSGAVGAGWMADVVGSDGVMAVVGGSEPSASRAGGFGRDANLSALIREELPVSDDAAAPLLHSDSVDVRRANSQESVIAALAGLEDSVLRDPETPTDLEEVDVMSGAEPLAAFLSPDDLEQPGVAAAPSAGASKATPPRRPLSDYAVLVAVAFFGVVLGAALF
jgi:hypothetical protein